MQNRLRPIHLFAEPSQISFAVGLVFGARAHLTGLGYSFPEDVRDLRLLELTIRPKIVIQSQPNSIAIQEK